MSSVPCKACQLTTVDLKITNPTPNKNAAPVPALPKADFLVVTWTEAETDAMALVLGTDVYSFEGADSNNFNPLLIAGLQPPEDKRFHGYFFQASVNGKTVVCLKSGFHPKLQPQETTIFFEKLIGPKASQNFKYLVTSGTSGGIWATLDLGDVVVINTARFGMTAPKEQQQLRFTGVSNVVGGNPPLGYSNWFDYVNAKILNIDGCVNGGLRSAGGRDAARGKRAIYYTPSGTNLTDVVTNSRISDDECGRIATYRTRGATLDENDAYVAGALKAVEFQNWVSIRNVFDLPCAPSSDDQYDNFGYCSSINGAYAVWAFVMGAAL